MTYEDVFVPKTELFFSLHLQYINTFMNDIHTYIHTHTYTHIYIYIYIYKYIIVESRKSGTKIAAKNIFIHTVQTKKKEVDTNTVLGDTP